MASEETTQIESRLGLTCVLVLAALSGATCLYIGTTDHGIYHPDEIYQTLEVAHRLVYGFGLRAWEWEIGARNVALPGLLAPSLGVSKLLGLESSPSYLWPTAAFSALLHAATVAGTYRLARTWRADRWCAAAGAILFAAAPAALYFSHRALPEVLSAPFVVWGLALALNPSSSDSGAISGEPRSRRLVGLSLLGASLLLRPHNALFCLALALILRFREPRERYLEAIRTFAVWGLLYGLIDFLYWGIPYQSAGAYLRFNLLMDGTTDYYGASSFFTYLWSYFQTMGVVGGIVLVAALAALRRARRLWLVAGVFFLAHQLFPHRQLRFLYVLFPLVSALAGIGLSLILDRISAPKWGAGAAVAILTTAALASTVYRWPRLDFGDLGQADTLRVEPSRSAHRFRHDVNRLLARAHDQTDLCGLKLERYWAVKTGGLTYLHRDVPVYHPLNPAPSESHYNYVLRPRTDASHEGSSDPGGRDERIVANRGNSELIRTDTDSCSRNPNYEPRIFRPN